MSKRQTGGFRLKGHHCRWTKREDFSVLHVALYIDSFDPLEDVYPDEFFTGATVKECIQAFRDWLLVPSNLKPYQDERLGAIAL